MLLGGCGKYVPFWVRKIRPDTCQGMDLTSSSVRTAGTYSHVVLTHSICSPKSCDVVLYCVELLWLPSLCWELSIATLAWVMLLLCAVLLLWPGCCCVLSTPVDYTTVSVDNCPQSQPYMALIWTIMLVTRKQGSGQIHLLKILRLKRCHIKSRYSMKR